MLRQLICSLLVSSMSVTGGISEEVYPSFTILADQQLIAQGIPQFVREESYGPWERKPLEQLPDSGNMGFDLRSYDVSAYDLTAKAEEIKDITFDTVTKWPDTLPDDFDPDTVLEMGKNPGLGIRGLHEKGITGKGVNIAIVDQSLLLDHKEYKGKIMSYELIHSSDEEASMHGSAVTSIAVGETCGVAPDARVYYISSTFGIFDTAGGYKEDLTPMADSILHLIELNQVLPDDQKIKVISISKGLSGAKGTAETKQAIKQANKAGIFVITTSYDKVYSYVVMGLGREFYAPPDDAASYGPGMFWADSFYDGYGSDERQLLVPMDARTNASFTGASDYAFGASGGSSWAVPWLAGLYALCVQVDPALTPEVFIETAFETGDSNILTKDGKSYTLGTIVNPTRLIAALQK